MGKKMAGTNEFAFFAVKAYVPGGVQNQAEKISKMPSGRHRYKNLLFQVGVRPSTDIHSP